MRLGEEFLLYERRNGLTDDEFIIVVLERQLDVGTQWSGGNAEDDLVRKVPEQLSETVVVGLIDYDQSQIFKLNALVVQSVVQRFHHGHEAPVIVFLVEFLDFAVDDFVRNADVRQHGSSARTIRCGASKSIRACPYSKCTASPIRRR